MDIKLRKIKEYIIYVLPVLFLLVGIWAFLNVLSMHYTRAISLIDWLLSGSDNIIATVRDVDTVMGRLQRIMLMRAFWVLWFAGFSVSIFMLGKHVHNKKSDTISCDQSSHGYSIEEWLSQFQQL